MAVYCHTARHDKGDVFKIIRQDKDGTITVNYCNLGDMLGVVVVLSHAKVRFAVRQLSEQERASYFASQSALWAAEGI
jgi:hypothetical protein